MLKFDMISYLIVVKLFSKAIVSYMGYIFDIIIFFFSFKMPKKCYSNYHIRWRHICGNCYSIL